MESFKRTHLQQNRELVQMNALYSSQIRRLENDLNGLRNENLELRERLIRAERQLGLKENQLQRQQDPLLVAAAASAVTMLKETDLNISTTLGKKYNEEKATTTTATTTAEATATIVTPPSLHLPLEELDQPDDHYDHIEQQQQQQQQQEQTNVIDDREHYSLSQNDEHRSNNDNDYGNRDGESVESREPVNIINENATIAVMPTPSKRVRTRISYALPSVKQKLRKGDPFTFNDPISRS